MQIRSMYDQELRDIQRDAFHMGNLVSEAMVEVMRACHRRDFTAIERAYKKDEEARRMRMAINDRVLKVVATQSPLAADLRKLFFLMHLCDELGRITAQLTGIGHTSMQMGEQVILFEEIYRMADKTATMLDHMLGAAASGDEETIQRVIAMDDEVDVIYEQLSRECGARTAAPADGSMAPLLGTYKKAKRWEGIADSVVNACRWWLYFNADREKYKGLLI